MADIKVTNYDRMAVADRGSEVLCPRKSWPATIQANGDKIHVGYLPAGHRLDKGLSAVTADGATGAFTYSLIIVKDDGSLVTLISAQAVVAATYTRTALGITDANLEALGVSDLNRDVYLLLSTAPTVAGGNVHVDLQYRAAG